MKKIIVLLLAVSLLVLSCTDSGSDSTPEAEKKTKFHVTYTGIQSGKNPEDTNDYSSGDEVVLAAGDNSRICSSDSTATLSFKGWSDGEKIYESGSIYVITGDITFTAYYDSTPCAPGQYCADGSCVAKAYGCDSNAHCANNADGKTMCDTASHTCVAPSSEF